LQYPYLFTGRRFDYETGLYYYRARYYNPYIGRFLQTDPVGYGDGINWYVYCKNNPLSFVDPSGLMQWATGRYWVLADTHTPDDFVVELRKGVSIGVGIMVGLISNELGVVTTITENNAQDLGAVSRGMWGTYMEVYDCCDVNGNGQIEDSEKQGDPYWIEVTTIGSGGTSTGKNYDATAGWLPERCGYGDVIDAMDAGGTAVAWALTLWDEKDEQYPKKWPHIPGLIPENWRVLQRYLYTANINPYGTRRYGVDEEDEE
jgi:RHS repeat-associated protein